MRIIIYLYYAYINTVKHDGFEHAGYLAFLSLLALFPALFFLMALTSYITQILEQYDLVESIKYFFINNISEEILSGLTPRINEIVSGPPPTLLKLAVIGSIWTASSAVEGLRTIINRAYHVENRHPYILSRLLSIVQFLLITFVIIIAMLILTFTPAIESVIAKFAKIHYQWLYMRYIISVLILLIAISWLYLILPNIKQNWLSVLPGATLVVTLWTITAISFSFYINHFQQVNLIYGSLGGVIISLLFFYVINLCLIYGAEFNYVLSQNRNRSL
ncbi:MAG: YihY/virulence factor BrkB family protein [Rickettsiaceae bacterium H1]|nr:YihY/virulence factor BrkB family protein [Rickettsiaceae bacterium H1]